MIHVRRLWDGRLYHHWRSALDRNRLRTALGADLDRPQRQFPERVSIFFIGTDRYFEYFPRYYRTLERHFLPETPKTFFVLTDRTEAPFLRDLASKKPEEVVPITVEHAPFPKVCLLKFEFMLRAREQLAPFSHCIYIDADCYAVREVSERRLFGHDRPLFALQHYNYVGRRPQRDAFETRPESRAAVSPNDALATYWQACFWGGERRAFVEALETLARATREDLERGIVARWWDESFLNKYLLAHRSSVHSCDPSFAWPEHKPMPAPHRPLLIHTNANPPESEDASPLKTVVRRAGRTTTR